MITSENKISLNKNFIILLNVLLVLILSAGGYFYYKYEEKRIYKDVCKELSTISKLKSEQIVIWRNERISEAKYFPNNLTVIKNVEILLRFQDTQAVSELARTLTTIKTNHLYENIFITNTTGKIIFSIDSAFTHIDKIFFDEAYKVVDSKEILFSDFKYCEEHDNIHLDIVSPIINASGSVIALFFLRIDPHTYLFPRIQSIPVSNESGESYLVKKENDSVRIMSELKYKSNKELLVSIPLSEKEIIAVKAIESPEEIIEGKDYNTEEVIASVNKLNNTDWILINSVRKSDVFSELTFKAIAIILLVILLLIITFVATSYFYANRQKQVYQKLLHAEKENSETQKEFRTSLYSIGDGVITTDKTGLIKYMNFVAEELTGWKEQDARGLLLKEVFHIVNEYSLAEAENPVERVLREGLVVGLANHTLLISKSGKQIPIADSGSPIRNDAGEIIGVVLVFRDQTEEREAERIIKESEKFLKDTQTIARLGTYTLDFRTGVWKSSVILDEIFGIDENYPHTVEGWGKIIHPEWQEEMLNYFNVYVAKEGNKFDKEYKIIRQYDNEPRWVHGLGDLESENGKLIRMIGTIQDITSRKNAELALIESEARMRVLIEGTPHLFFYTQDVEGNITYISPSVKNITGHSIQEWLGQKHWFATENSINDLARNRTRENLEGKISSEPIYVEINHADGKAILLEVYEKPVFDNHKVVGLQGVAHDITAQKESERKLKESEERFRLISGLTTDYLFSTRLNSDGNHKMDWVLGALEKITGYTFEEYIKIGGWRKTLHPDDVKKDDEAFYQLSNNQTAVCEVRTIRKDGKVVWNRSYGYPVWDSNENRLVGIYGAVQDITDQKLAEESIRKFIRGIEQSPAIIVITDSKGFIEYVNPKFSEVSGYKFEEVKNKKMRILKLADEKIGDYAHLWEIIHNKQDWHGEFYNKKKDGSYYWESVSISPILDEDNNITNIIGIMEDITLQKQLNADLVSAKEKAEEMNRIKTYFYANMSHELRTPFVGIVGFTELLSETLENPEHKEMAEAILKSSRRLTDTLNKILNVTKLEFDKLEVVNQPVEVYELITSLHTLYSKSAALKNLKLEVSFNCDNCVIQTDEKLLREVLNNLINNAIKYTEQGKIQIIVDRKVSDQQESLIIAVADTGVGIPKHLQNIIWQEFRQVSEGFNRSFEGTGLGLSITKKYVELIGGSIILESEPGKGSVFTIILPVKIEKDDTVTAKPKAEIINSAESIDVDKVTNILYVEDDPIAVDFVSRILSKQFNITISRTADEALDKLKINSYDILLVDINLGHGMDGVELTQIIRKMPRYNDIPIVAVTAYASNNDKAEFLSKGLSHYLSKPFTSRDLLHLLELIVKKK